ncbi:unnamed protein product [Ilex paraguariensis]|uniref:Uncharacterized protein n=1 Tax=Ilex paraguariensis TaxID=185542 RepID=A0ABC8R9X5_9AQUA
MALATTGGGGSDWRHRGGEDQGKQSRMLEGCFPEDQAYKENLRDVFLKTRQDQDYKDNQNILLEFLNKACGEAFHGGLFLSNYADNKSGRDIKT